MQMSLQAYQTRVQSWLTSARWARMENVIGLSEL